MELTTQAKFPQSLLNNQYVREGNDSSPAVYLLVSDVLNTVCADLSSATLTSVLSKSGCQSVLCEVEADSLGYAA